MKHSSCKLMKAKGKLILFVLLFVIIGTGGCGKEEEESEAPLIIDYPKVKVWNEFVDKLQVAFVAGIAADVIFPEWLLLKINDIEKRPPNIWMKDAEIYQGEWNNQVVYYYYFYETTGFFDLLCEDTSWVRGSQIDFLTNSKNWKLIYEYGAGENLLRKIKIGIDEQLPSATRKEFLAMLIVGSSDGIVENGIFPEWLLSKIKYNVERNTLFFAKIAEIYQAELNGKVIYFYFNCFTETGFGEFF
ncbi:MAG: hypothetical protein LBT25_09590, partial [Candidatus Symbiothrix sp.]|nr:hypothetical protein [Candidatus Symbiothrix sp.]